MKEGGDVLFLSKHVVLASWMKQVTTTETNHGASRCINLATVLDAAEFVTDELVWRRQAVFPNIPKNKLIPTISHSARSSNISGFCGILLRNPVGTISFDVLWIVQLLIQLLRL